MTKKKESCALGKALIKDRFSKKPRKSQNSFLHTCELNDGYDWNHLNLNSVTEQTTLDDFLSTAQLAGTEFQAEKLNVTFVNPSGVSSSLSTEKRRVHEEKIFSKEDVIKIPHRPKWDKLTSKEELDAKEKAAFLDWRRHLALIQEVEGLTLTPYERNIEVWRHLWRVVEKSDIIVQLVDARNPLLFRCKALEEYVSCNGKINFLLINKADLLTEGQISAWAEWLKTNRILATFFSAEASMSSMNIGKQEKEKVEGNDQQSIDREGEEIESSKEDFSYSNYCLHGGETVTLENAVEELPTPSRSPLQTGSYLYRLLDRSNLIDLFKSLQLSKEEAKGNNNADRSSNEAIERDQSSVVVGLVGYPNVGKSSTINALLGTKKMSVSTTPGKTKHFQTIHLEPGIVLCDCPGLVMPSVVESKASMVLAGIIHSDTAGDLMEPVSLLCKLMGRQQLEQHYGLMLPKPLVNELQDRPPTAEEFLGLYAYSRGFMTAGGRADTSRAARYIVKNFVSGRLIYATAPPETDQEEFNKTGCKRINRLPTQLIQPTPQALRATQMTRQGQDLDKMFFSKMSLGAHTKGRNHLDSHFKSDSEQQKAKPWKDHSSKRNKKEKLRRVYRHLDE